jgi:hypothetical protein
MYRLSIGFKIKESGTKAGFNKITEEMKNA